MEKNKSRELWNFKIVDFAGEFQLEFFSGRTRFNAEPTPKGPAKQVRSPFSSEFPRKFK